MAQQTVIELIAFPDWIVAVTHRRTTGFCCWVITPELVALTDGETYSTSQDALEAGRSLVYCSTEPPIDFSRCRLYD
ncbi:hypothetical protein [Nodosilinea sp. E11]|uniref:hypothetical protein n=1 Tax=Nodosilinea sp. E11 TaxID=3037479 RepID=UPI002934E83F|nr:hypothetical protein [Nodosilinea sp. E11]WOD37131.1 hypothetical protein RRF56_01325 [Nodosilinea sp. E11]